MINSLNFSLLHKSSVTNGLSQSDSLHVHVPYVHVYTKEFTNNKCAKLLTLRVTENEQRYCATNIITLLN